MKFNRLERDLELLDLIFVPSSLIRLKQKIEKENYRKISNLWYTPIIPVEIARILIEAYFIYNNLKNYLN
jgi:hypothetical protein